jgi:hypothetical protein
MNGSGESPTLAPEVRIRLAGSGDNLRRWYRLRRLLNRLRVSGASPGELEELVVALEESFDAAAGEAEAVAALLEEHADEIDAVLAAGVPDLGDRDTERHLANRPDSGGARRTAQRLRELPGLRTSELESVRDEYGGQPVPAIGKTAFCSIAKYLEEEATWECIGGVEGACSDAVGYILDQVAAGC